jgi:dTDP-4-amino-4,6-dideoxygalactose transaminase
MAPYAASHQPNDRSLAVSEKLSQQVLALPTGTGVTKDDVETICQVVRNLVARAPEVRERFASGVCAPARV